MGGELAGAALGRDLEGVIGACHRLLAAWGEAPEGADGAVETGFGVTARCARPGECLQLLLDLIRVQFEPRPLGTFFLNANLGLLLERLEGDRCDWGYLSVVGEPGQSFATLWREGALAGLGPRGYLWERVAAAYVIVTTGDSRYGYGLVDEVLHTLGSGVEPATALALLAGAGRRAPPGQTLVESGFCRDPALGEALRVSCALLIQPPRDLDA